MSGTRIDFLHQTLNKQDGGKQMEYYNTRVVNLSFDEAISKVTEELKKEGFGVLTEIDVKETLKKKLDVDFRKYKILGACNPPFAYKALQAEDKIGTMLPCNIIVQETREGKTEVSSINPRVSMQTVKNEELESVASEIADKLKRVLENV
jgi:uncharacterized protein (DUF302 family)